MKKSPKPPVIMPAPGLYVDRSNIDSARMLWMYRQTEKTAANFASESLTDAVSRNN
jgi:hypothetical protein